MDSSTQLDTEQAQALIEAAVATARTTPWLADYQVPLAALDHTDGLVIGWGEDIGEEPMVFTLTTFDGETRRASIAEYLKGYVKGTESLAGRFAQWADKAR